MQEIRYFYQEEKKLRFKKFFRILVFIVLLLFTLNVLANSYLNIPGRNTNLILSPLSTVEKVIQKTSFMIKSQENSQALEKTVKSVLKNQTGYSVYIKNLKTGERYFLNENTQYETASLYKLWVMAVVYKQIENGMLTKDEILSASVSDLNNKFNIASESAELTEGDVSWSVREALKNMITISDNYSALLLSSKVKMANVSQFLKDNGFLSSKVGTLETNPVSNAKDMGLFFEKLYSAEFVSQNESSEMLNLLKDQKINTKLSKYLPQDVVIGHKTGELAKFSHDAGIVFLDKNDYIIVVMSETSNQLIANENIANLSKEVYQYFNR